MAACFLACTRVSASSMFWICPSFPRYSNRSVSLSFSRPFLWPTAVMPVSPTASLFSSSAALRSSSIRLSIRRSLTVKSCISCIRSACLSSGTACTRRCSSRSRQSKRRVSNSPVVTAFLFFSGAAPPLFPAAFLFPGWPPFFFATLRFFFCNVALSQSYLFFQLRIVPSGIFRRSEISISFLPSRNRSLACFILASGALAMHHHLSFVFVLSIEKEPRWVTPTLRYFQYFTH